MYRTSGGEGQDEIKVMHFSDEHHAHQIAAGSVLNLWEERKAHEQTQAEERRRKSSLGSDGDAQQVGNFLQCSYVWEGLHNRTLKLSLMSQS